MWFCDIWMNWFYFALTFAIWRVTVDLPSWASGQSGLTPARSRFTRRIRTSRPRSMRRAPPNRSMISVPAVSPRTSTHTSAPWAGVRTRWTSRGSSVINWQDPVLTRNSRRCVWLIYRKGGGQMLSQVDHTSFCDLYIGMEGGGEGLVPFMEQICSTHKT